MSSPLPVILCGKTEQIATSVITTLKPEYEVVHLVLSRSAGCAQIPLILAGKPAPSDTELGSKIYTTRPIAVLTGAGYDEAAVEDMMKATAEQKDTKPIP